MIYIFSHQDAQTEQKLNALNLQIPGNETLEKRQETAKSGMTGLQSGNIIGKDPPRTNINAEVNIKYCMTLNRQSQG